MSASTCPCAPKKQPCCGTLPTPTCKPCVGQFTPYYDPIETKKPEPQLVVIKQCEKPSKPCELPFQSCQRLRCVPPKCKTICFTCPPRKDPYCCDPRPYELAYADAFENFSIEKKTECNANPRWFYLSNGNDFLADNGSVKVHPNGGLILSQTSFTLTYPRLATSWPQPQGYLNGLKCYIVLNSQFELRDCGQLKAEVCGSAAVNNGNWRGLYESAIYNAGTDPRVGAGSLCSLFAFNNAIHLEVLATNDALIANNTIYPTFDAFDGIEGSHASYYALQLMGYRQGVKPIAEFHKVAVAIDIFKRKATYYLEGVVAAEFQNFGIKPDPETIVADMGGVNELVVPSIVNFGFGLRDMLDATIPLFTTPVKDHEANYIGLCKLRNAGIFNPYKTGTSAEELPTLIPSPTRDDLLFGQGASINLKSVTITYDS